MADQAVKDAIKFVQEMAGLMAECGATRDQINAALKDAVPSINEMIAADRSQLKAQRLRRTLLQAIEPPAD